MNNSLYLCRIVRGNCLMKGKPDLLSGISLIGQLNKRDMKKLFLKDVYCALVDDEDYDDLVKYKWYLSRGKYTNYATRVSNGKTILLHRHIMKPPQNMEIDHIDRNGLNCQKHNMRICTHSQNNANKKSKGGRCRYRGVGYNTQKYKNRISHYIIADITVNSKTIHLGYFKTEEEAALAYNEAALKYFGEFAQLNKI